MKKTIIACAVLAMVSCKPEKGQNASSANDHMNQSGFRELVKRFEDPNRDAWQKPEALIERLDFRPEDIVADIGAGTGYFSFKVAPKVQKVIATDVDQRFVDYLDSAKTPFPNVETRLAPTDATGLADRSIDKILMVNVAHHIEKRGKYFNKAKKALVFGGACIIVDFFKDAQHGPPKEMKVSYKEMIKDVYLGGFTQIEVDSTLLPQQYILIAR